MNPQAKVARGPGLAAAVLGAGVPILDAGTRPEGPRVDPNACAVQSNFYVQFPDGDNIIINPPFVGTERGNVEELFAALDAIVFDVKEQIKLRFAQRIKRMQS